MLLPSNVLLLCGISAEVVEFGLGERRELSTALLQAPIEDAIRLDAGYRVSATMSRSSESAPKRSSCKGSLAAGGTPARRRSEDAEWTGATGATTVRALTPGPCRGINGTCKVES